MARMTPNDFSLSSTRCVAITQEHRGHGASTATYYLGRVLVSEGLRVLLIDLTGRRSRLQTLLARGPAKNLGLWMPPVPRPAELHLLIDRARRETAGRVDVLLLDADSALLEHAGGTAAGIDYTLLVTESSASGQDTADRFAERMHDEPPPYGRIGVVFSRVDATAEGLPEQTQHRGLPVMGVYPADYLLAAGDDYSLKGGEPSWPHDKYLYALLRLGRQLIRRVPLVRVMPRSGITLSGEPATQNSRTQNEAHA